MTKRHQKASDGKYHIKGQIFQLLKGSRAQVWHGTAYKTAGGLTKSGLKKNKHGNIVSKAKSNKGGVLLKRLTDKGYFTRKGKFGFVKKSPKASGTTRKRKHTRRRRRGPKGRYSKNGWTF